MTDILKPRVSTLHSVLGRSPKIPSTGLKQLPPSIESAALNALLQTRFSTSSAKLLPCPISHQTLMDLLWKSIITLSLLTVSLCSFFGPIDGHGSTAYASGGPNTRSNLCWPSLGSSSALVLFTLVRRHSRSVSTQNKRQ